MSTSAPSSQLSTMAAASYRSPAHSGRRFAGGVGLAMLGQVITVAFILMLGSLLVGSIVDYLTLLAEVVLLTASLVLGIRAIRHRDPGFGWACWPVGSSVRGSNSRPWPSSS